MGLIEDLSAAKTLDDLQSAVGKAQIEELDARRGRKVSVVLECCATEISDARAVINLFLSRAFMSRSVAQINALASDFQKEFLKIGAGEEALEGGEAADAPKSGHPSRIDFPGPS